MTSPPQLSSIDLPEKHHPTRHHVGSNSQHVKGVKGRAKAKLIAEHVRNLTRNRARLASA
jgi:hypothetical protein